MSILFGCPTANPNSHNAALAYLEAGLLECLCVPWMPSAATIRMLSLIRPLRPSAQRLARRQFAPLSHIPKVQDRVGEICRLLMRAMELDGYRLFGQAPADQLNRWLMRAMARECHRSTIRVVHAYEDSSLWQFLEARRLGKACVYDMPICYYPAREKTHSELHRKYSDWLQPNWCPTTNDRLLEQKRREMTLADLTLVASEYAAATIREFYPHKDIALAPYGVDAEFWTPGPMNKPPGPLRFMYAGQVSLRKGIPLLIEAWSKAELRDAELVLVGSWFLADSKRRSLPPGVKWFPPCSAQALRDRYRESDVFVFPSFAEGFGLVLLEAMACGLPAIASEASIGPEIITAGCGFISPTGDLDRLVELLRWFNRHRNALPAMGQKARAQASRCTWSNYRSLVIGAVSKLV
jgi:glycosyltransferase involved in cell wall biosynthesis